MRRLPAVHPHPLPAVLMLFLCLGCAGVNHRRETLSGEQGILQGFTGVYRVAYAEGSSRRRANLAVAFASPDRLRLEVIDALGNSRAVLVLSGGGALVLNPAERAFRAFATGREALEALAGIPVEAGLFSALLLAQIPRWPGAECRPAPDPSPPDDLECVGEGGDPSIRLQESGREARIRFRSGAAIVVRYDDRPKGPPGVPPHSLRIEGSRPGVRVELEVREMHGGRPGEDIFSTAPPKGFRRLAPSEEGLPPFALRAP